MVCADAERSGTYTATSALNALDALGAKASSRKVAIAALPEKDSKAVARAAGYPGRLEKTLSETVP